MSTTTRAPEDAVELTQTVLTLDARHTAVRNALLDAHHMHALVMSGFQHLITPSMRTPRADLSVLYAVRANQNATLSVLVQSPHTPDWSAFAAAAFSATPVSWTRPRITAGTHQFQTTINPVRRRTTTEGRKSWHLRSPDEQAQWLHERLEQHGARLELLYTATPAGTLTSQIKSKPRQHRHRPTDVFHLELATLTGTLDVTDPDRFTHAMTHGIGKGRAYGAGLILTR